MQKTTSVPFGHFMYMPVHCCPVCGLPVYDVPPFGDDCRNCSDWSVSFFKAAIHKSTFEEMVSYSVHGIQPPVYSLPLAVSQ